MAEIEDPDLEWRLIWRTDHSYEERDEYLSTGLPRYMSDKYNKVRFTFATENISDAEPDLNLSTNLMGSILTECRSQLCKANEDGEACWCRYKINTGKKKLVRSLLFSSRVLTSWTTFQHLRLSDHE